MGDANRLETQESVEFKSKAVEEGRANVTDKVQRWSAGEFPLAWGRPTFDLTRPPPNLMRSTHIMEDSVLYSRSADLNANLIQKYAHRNFQNNVWQNIWAP